MSGLHTSVKNQQANDKLAAISKIFHLLGTDCKKNINIILEQACHIIDASCSMFNQMDVDNNLLITHDGYNLPDDFEKKRSPEGRLCYETTIKAQDPVIIGNLEESEFYHTDPSIQKYNIKSYLGFPIKRRDKIIGSFCVLDNKTREFCPDEINCIQTLAASLALEEERMLAEKENRIEKERYRLLVENANDAICIIQDGVLKFANPKSIAMSGYTAQELTKLPFEKLIHPDDREYVKNNHYRRVKGEEVIGTYAFKTVNKHNETIYLQINTVPVLWENKLAFLYCARDLTRLKELEKKLQRAEKMELVGTMAGGVAHDLNNILAGLVSYPELLLLQLEKGSKVYEAIKFVHESGLKAADIVQDLLTLARRGVNVSSVVNLNLTIKEYINSPTHKRVETSYPTIQFKTELDPNLSNLKGSPVHISKIIMNLVINAAEAVSKNGRISIETYNQYVDTPFTSYDTVVEGDYVVLVIRDNGSGIDEQDLNCIFEPFYTTKEMGKSGSGLGLSVVWNSMQDHNGYIEVKTQKDSGTTFELYFPATAQLLKEKSIAFEIEEFNGNQETVLVVDDLEVQRKIATDCLNLLKYSPLIAESGEKAINILKEQPVDILLLDMEMAPGIDGLETYKKALEINPNQKAIIASGYAEDNRVKEALRLGAGKYIKKPYTIKSLAQALKEHLV